MAPRRRCTTSPAFSAWRVSAFPIVPWASTPPAMSSISPRFRRRDSSGLGPGTEARPRAGRSAAAARGRQRGLRAARRRRAGEEIQRLAEGVRQVAGAERAHRPPASSRARRHGEGRRIRARLPDQAAARGARGARRGDRGGAQEVCAEAGRPRRAAAADGAGGRARTAAGVRSEDADRRVDGRDAARRAVRAQGGQRRYARPRDDHGTGRGTDA